MRRKPHLGYIRRHIKYDPITGRLAWINPEKMAGRKVEGPSKRGYWTCWIGGQTHGSHRIAYAIYYGQHPKGQIDHINGDRGDNRIINLRDVTVRTNSSNQPKQRAGKLVGGTYLKKENLWVAAIAIKGRTIRLGKFTTEQEAHESYIWALARARSLGWAASDPPTPALERVR